MRQAGVEITSLSLLVLNLTLLGGDGGGKVARQLLANNVLLVLRRGRDRKGIFDRGEPICQGKAKDP